MVSLFAPGAYVTFCLASAALVAAPGPAQALVLTRTLQAGTRAGLLTAFGLEIGTAVHTLAAALGLSAILATSATAFDAVKYVGAAYLVLLGIRAIRATGRGTVDAAVEHQPPAATHLLAHATVTGLLNPKVALFFLAFLPQFVDPTRGNPFLQFVILGFTFAGMGVLGDGLLAIAAGRARRRIASVSRWTVWRERLSGLVLIGLGIRLALTTRR